VHAAEHGGFLGRLGGDPGQRKRVADMVRDILDGRKLVIVRQDGGVAQRGQPTNLGRPELVTLDAGVTGGCIGDVRGQIACQVF
jgi:hypothetical protein